ncbi:MAG: AMP-dependent synthetase/ligase [Deltaproteobacteria bacterium]
MKITRIFDILNNYIEKYPDQNSALACKRNGKWLRFSIGEYKEITDLISLGLIHAGLNPGDNIGIVGKNRPEWNMIDMAIMQAGGISVPIYPTISEQDYRFILRHSEMKMIFIDGDEILKKLEPVIGEMPNLRECFLFDMDKQNRFRSLEDLKKLGKENSDNEKLEAIKNGIKSTDLATIIYTSGTTGNPKGVMLSHSNIVNQILNLCKTPAKWSKTALSFLPVCHAYERMMVYLYQYLGMSVYYAESIDTIAANIKEIRPTMMTCVPRLLEKIYDKLYHAGENLEGSKRSLYFWAFELATKYQLEGMSFWLKLKLKIADKLIYSKWRAAIGGNFDIVVSGGSAIQPHIASFFSAIGMPVFEGYGMSEASPVIAVSQRVKNGRKFGTVGLPLPGVEIRLSEMDEILCRGHNVMMGYYKDPELTAKTIDKEGWLHTGDTGKFTKQGQLIITGRLKSIFKTSYGKYINPQLIESKFTESPYFENMMVLGENKKYAAAIIAPDFTFLKIMCDKAKLPCNNNIQMLENKIVMDQLEGEIKKFNEQFGHSEQIKKWKIVSDQWSQDGGQLSPTLKIKRNVLEKLYQKEIKELFE